MLDLVLAISHHLLIFGIFGILFAEFWVVRPGISSATAARIASIDLWYGILPPRSWSAHLCCSDGAGIRGALVSFQSCVRLDNNVGMAHQCARLIDNCGSDAIACQPAVPPSGLGHFFPIFTGPRK